ncbi:MAG: S9 family peptidase, partial [Bacteroidia bacterium]|nr:S9 family peptidase [Bacteroidia bacterium]
MRKIALISCLLLSAVNYFVAQNSITLDDLYKKGTFRPEMLGGFNSMSDGNFYADFDDKGNLCKYEFKTGNKIVTLVNAADVSADGKQLDISSYKFSADESKIMILQNKEPIYRRSSKEENFVFDLKSKGITKVSTNGKQMFADFSPNAKMVAFGRDNNLFVKDLASGKETQITADGEWNKIKNGWSDWVYEEEFGFAKAFWWNADGTKIAFLRFDESNVKEYAMTLYNSLYPTQYKYKYPKTGDGNSVLSLLVYDVASAKTTSVDLGTNTDIYIPRVQWTKDANVLSYQRMNRLQNKNELFFYDVKANANKLILTEEAKTYVDVKEDLTFLAANKGFIWSSERDGYNQMYFYDFTGKLINQVTKGNWDVMQFCGIDEAAKKLYYISTEISATDRDLYVVDLNGKNKKKLSTGKGTNEVEFSSNFKFYFNNYSEANTPPLFTLHTSDGKLIKTLEDNKNLKLKMTGYNLSRKEFFTFKTSEGIELNGWMMKPQNFTAEKKYPVYMFAYGGPGSNECNNQWDPGDYFWHQLLCQEGYMVVCVDNRGTQGRGRDFKHSTYMQLGKLETIDQIETAKYLGGLPYVDKTRIGFQGWSYGGYMASLL